MLWPILDDINPSKKTRKCLTVPDNICYFSIVSLWEITIKHALGALNLEITLDECIKTITVTGSKELPVTQKVLIELSKLPQVHKDPFDRILTSQAIQHQFSFISIDSNAAKYNVKIVLLK